MSSLSNIERRDVLNAIALCDELGREAFLTQYGYGDSIRYQLRHDGRSYPSKAIVGVAGGLRPRDFFAGIAQTAPCLDRLGFEIRVGRRVVNEQLIALASKHQLGRRRTAWTKSASAYFASGSNRVGEIRGLAAVGHDIGVAVPELTDEAVLELAKLEGTDVNVFVDSGAYSEVRFTQDGPVVVREMTELAWARVFAIYLRLAHLRTQLWIVAPDRIGDQELTLARLAEHRAAIRELIDAGVRVLVVMQKGTDTQAIFARRVTAVIGEGWIPALPAKKAATSPAELATFVDELKPKHVHLLGLGVTNRNVDAYVSALGSTTVSLDSSWIRANVGTKGYVRRYTRGRRIASTLVVGAAAVAELGLMIALGV